MNVKTLQTIPPWEWPEGTAEVFLDILRDRHGDASWPHIAALVTSEETGKPLLLAAIEAAGCIRPQEAAEILYDLTDSDDEDIAEAAYETLAMAGALSDLEDDEDDED